jgi:hypothetical protein
LCNNVGSLLQGRKMSTSLFSSRIFGRTPLSRTPLEVKSLKEIYRHVCGRLLCSFVRFVTCHSRSPSNAASATHHTSHLLSS